MKKLYAFLTALVVSISAYATEAFEGDWTFTVLEINNGQMSSTPTTLQVTCSVFDYGEALFYLPDNKGAIYVGSFETINSDGTRQFRFEGWPNSTMTVKDTNYYQNEQSFYLDFGDPYNSQVFADFDESTGKFVKFYRKNFMGNIFEEQIGFTIKTYSSMLFNDSNLLTNTQFVLVSAEMGGASEPQPSILVSLPEGSYSGTYDTATTAKIVATPQIAASNVEDYKVFYNLKNDSQTVVNDTEITPVDGTYTIEVGGLNFMWNYTLNVWATAGDYTSSTASTLVYTGDQPELKINSATVANEALTTADINVTVMPYGLENLTYTFTATSENGPAAEAVTTADRTATLSLTGLDCSTEYTYNVQVTGKDANGVEFTTLSKAVTVTTTDPTITISFGDGNYTSTPQPDASWYAQIVATPTIESDVDDFKVFYNLYMGATKYKNAVEVTPNAEGEYEITVQGLNYSRLYKLEVYATAGNFSSEAASVEITTCDEPSLKITSATAQNITENSAQIVVEFAAISLGENLTYSVMATSTNGPAVQAITTQETSATLEITGLNPGTLYTYNVSVQVTTESGSMKQADQAVSFETEEASQTITLSGISYSQIESGATFRVNSLESMGFEEGTEFAVYFQLQGSDAAPATAAVVTNGDETYYEYTFENLTPLTPYTAIIFGGAGEYGTDNFFKGTEYKENFVTGQVGIEATCTDNTGNVRYFNLQGIEINNAAPGTAVIKVEGTKVSKVIVK